MDEKYVDVAQQFALSFTGGIAGGYVVTVTQKPPSLMKLAVGVSLAWFLAFTTWLALEKAK